MSGLSPEEIRKLVDGVRDGSAFTSDFDVPLVQLVEPDRAQEKAYGLAHDVFPELSQSTGTEEKANDASDDTPMDIDHRPLIAIKTMMQMKTKFCFDQLIDEGLTSRQPAAPTSNSSRADSQLGARSPSENASQNIMIKIGGYEEFESMFEIQNEKLEAWKLTQNMRFGYLDQDRVAPVVDLTEQQEAPVEPIQLPDPTIGLEDTSEASADKDEVPVAPQAKKPRKLVYKKTRQSPRLKEQSNTENKSSTGSKRKRAGSDTENIEPENGAPKAKTRKVVSPAKAAPLAVVNVDNVPAAKPKGRPPKKGGRKLYSKGLRRAWKAEYQMKKREQESKVLQTQNANVENDLGTGTGCFN